MARAGAIDRGLFERVPGSNVWSICYSDAQGKKRREVVGMKRAAQALYRQRKREVREGISRPEPVKRALTFKEITLEALKRSKAENASWKTDEGRAADLLKKWGSRSAESIGPREIQDWLYEFMDARKLSPSTINKYRALMSGIYSYAIQGERLNVNPVRATKPLKVENSRTRWLTPGEEKSLLTAIEGPEYRIAVLFALHTGVRRTAQFNLKWTDIQDGVAYFAKTKNGDEQYVPLNSLIQGYLSTFPRTSEYVFQNCHEELIRNNMLYWWYRALKKARLTDFRWHDLRHTFATRLARKTKNLRLLQGALSHKSPQMTARYAHLVDEDMVAAMEALV